VSDYWVGEIGSALFVYDEDIQPLEESTVTLFCYSFDELVKLDKMVVKERIKKAKGPNVEDALKRFRNWKKFYSSSLKKN
jgi:hypothetical protein